MTNIKKEDLQWTVRYYLARGKSHVEIVKLLQEVGFKKETIKKYIKVFSK